MKLNKLLIDGLNDLYKYIGEVINDEEYGKSQFRNHLGDVYYSINIHMDIEQMNLLEVIFAKKMYGDNLIILESNKGSLFIDNIYEELYKSCPDDRSPLFGYSIHCKLILNGPPILGILSTSSSFDPVGFLYSVTHGNCFTKDNKFISNISKYQKDIEEQIKLNFVNNLYSFMYKTIFDGDILSDFAIESLIFKSKSGLSLDKITTMNDSISFSDKDAIVTLINNMKKEIEKFPNPNLYRDLLKSSTYIEASVSGTIKDLYDVLSYFPSHCVTNHTPFLVIINRDTLKLQEENSNYLNIITENYSDNLLKRAVCLFDNSPCDFKLRISYKDLTDNDEKDKSELVKSIYRYSSLIFDQIINF